VTIGSGIAAVGKSAPTWTRPPCSKNSNINDLVLDGRESRIDKFVILSIDLVGSTLLSHSVDAKQNARIIQVYTNEIVTAAAKFHGVLLKPMGDGLLLYFPTGNFITRNDLAMDAAMTMRDLVLNGLNPELETLSLPKIGCRIGIDSGEAVSEIIGSGGSTIQMDLIGETVNLAAKIEKIAVQNAIYVGETAARSTHTMWRKWMNEVALPTTWAYKDKLSALPYKVYNLEIRR
jgi:class 3 adenylate cyclase